MQTTGRNVILAWLTSVALCSGPANAKVKMCPNPEKAAKVVMVHYDKTWDFTSAERATEHPWSEHDTEEVRWDLEQPGYWIWDECYGNAESYTYNWSDTHWDADGDGDTQLTLYEDVCGVRNPGLYEPCTVSSTWWPGEFSVGGASRVVCDGYSLWDQKVQRKASTRYELYTGGKKVSGQKNLFVLTASVLGQGLFGWETYSLASSSVKLGSLGNLGSDGRLYAALGGGGTYNVTPYVGGWRYYTFDQPGMSKHTPYILADNTEAYAVLDPEKTTVEFCVGQKITFWSAWDSTPPGLTSENGWDWVTSAKSVNYQSVPNSAGCVTYENRPDLWRVAQPYAWWISGGNKNAKLDLALNFDNGQSAKVQAKGKFNMLKPRVTRVLPAPPFGGVIDTSGVPLLWLNDGAMDFRVYITKTYPGKFGVTQLVNYYSQTIIIPPSVFIWHSTYGDFYLDKREYYETPIDIVLESFPSEEEYSTPTKVYDTPGQYLALVLGSYNGNWKDYVRFTPAGAGSIPITLGRIEWSWAATAEMTNGFQWIKSADGMDGPTLHEDDSFPGWTTTKTSPDQESNQ